MLRVEALTVAAHERTLVENLSLDLGEGTITCLIGPSGCGKTSVIKWLAGILPPGLAATGKLAIDGRNISRPIRQSATSRRATRCFHGSP